MSEELLVGILIALIAMIAALVGAILTAKGVGQTLQQAAALETKRWEREDGHRHEESRREAYPAFLAVIDEGVIGINALMNQGGPADQPFAGPHWSERARGSLAVIEFVGSSDTFDCALRLHRAARRLIRSGSILLTIASQAAPEPATEGVPESADANGPTEADTEDEIVDASPSESTGGSSWGDIMGFLNQLPYPLGEDPDPDAMYGGNPWIQYSMAGAELRIRRHEYLNAARIDLGMGELPYPQDPQNSAFGPTAEDLASTEGLDAPDDDAASAAPGTG